MNEAQALAGERLGRVRNLSLDVRPPPLDDLGLCAALLWHFERYASSTGVKVGFTSRVSRASGSDGTSRSRCTASFRKP